MSIIIHFDEQHRVNVESTIGEIKTAFKETGFISTKIVGDSVPTLINLKQARYFTEVPD